MVTDKTEQIRKAERFLALHHDPQLLILPNIWDPLGARLLEGLGFPAVATASAAVAYSLGHDDGQKIGFATMLDVIGRIASAVDLPVTADVESGYAEDPREVALNVQQVLRAGAIGINLEDSLVEGGELRPIEFQCARIRAVREMAEEEGIHLVINARTDVYLGSAAGSKDECLAETIERAEAYLDAGADCVYPIPLGDVETLGKVCSAIKAPLNAYASESAAPLRELEAAGIARVSVGPGLLKASLTAMKRVALDLKNYGTYESLTKDVISSDEVGRYVRGAGLTRRPRSGSPHPKRPPRESA